MFCQCRLSADGRFTKSKVISPSGKEYAFDVDEFRKHCLLNGLDDIGLTLQHADDIKALKKNPKRTDRGCLKNWGA